MQGTTSPETSVDASSEAVATAGARKIGGGEAETLSAEEEHPSSDESGFESDESGSDDSRAPSLDSQQTEDPIDVGSCAESEEERGSVTPWEGEVSRSQECYFCNCHSVIATFCFSAGRWYLRTLLLSLRADRRLPMTWLARLLRQLLQPLSRLKSAHF